MNTFQGIKSTRRLLGLILQRLNLVEENLNELSKEELFEIMSGVSNIDLSWVASQESVDAVKAEVTEIRGMINAIDIKIDKLLGNDTSDENGGDNPGGANGGDDIDEEEDIASSLTEFTPLSDYTYTQDDDNRIVTLTKYNGGPDANIVMPKSYNIDGVWYKTVLEGWVYEDRTLKNLHSIVSFVAEPGTELGANASTFRECTKLTSVTLDGIDTSKVTSMANMFNSCKALTSLNVSAFDTSNVTNMDSMFYGCSKLTSLDLTSFDTSKVTSMSAMFDASDALESIDISSFDTSQVTTMYNMFYYCKALAQLKISPLFDTSKVTSMASMFNMCNVLPSLDLTSFNILNVTDMSNMFYGCSALTEIRASRSKWVIPDGCKTTYMFQACGVSDVTYID